MVLDLRRRNRGRRGCVRLLPGVVIRLLLPWVVIRLLKSCSIAVVTVVMVTIEFL